MQPHFSLWFIPLPWNWYNDPMKHEHVKLLPLCCAGFQQMATDLLKVWVLPFVQTLWRDGYNAISALVHVSRLEIYCAYLQNAGEHVITLHELLEPARSVHDGQSTVLVWHEGKLRTPTVCCQYEALETILAATDVYGDPVFINSFALTDLLPHCQNVHAGTMWWIWKVPIEASTLTLQRQLISSRTSRKCCQF